MLKENPLLLGIVVAVCFVTSLRAETELKVVVPDMPVYRGNPFTGLNSPTIYTWSALFDTLTRVDQDGVVQPSLAIKWQNLEPNVWRFYLRPDIKFHNGESFDAHAVTTAAIWLKGEQGRITTTGKDIDAIVRIVRVIDPLIVDFLTNEPDAIFPANISEMHIPAPRAWSELGPTKFSQAPSGTGPFQLVRWTENGAYMEVDHNSWRRSRQIQKLRIFEAPDRISRVQALLAGQADIAIGLSYDNIDTVENAGHRVMIKPAPLVSGLQIVSVRPDRPFADRRVRLAANLAVNREAIASTLLRNMAQPANQPAAQHANGYNPHIPQYPYDPDRARQLLAEAGYPNGFDGRMEVVIEATIPASLETQLQVAADLSQVGIRLDVIPIQFATWLRKWYGSPNSTSVDFPDMFSLNIILAPQLDVGRIFRTHSCEKTINGYPGFHCDPSAMPLIRQSRQEFNSDRRRDLLYEIMEKYHQNPSAIYLFTLMDVTGLRQNIRNLKNVNRHYAYEEVIID